MLIQVHKKQDAAITTSTHGILLQGLLWCLCVNGQTDRRTIREQSGDLGHREESTEVT